MHELIHNITGDVDFNIQNNLGIDNGPSVNIANKLELDCLK